MPATSQIRRNAIARQSGVHRHDFAQILIGWRGTLLCEFEQTGQQLHLGDTAIAPAHQQHQFSGLDPDCELIVLDIHFQDPQLLALQHSSQIDLQHTLFSQASFRPPSQAWQALIDYAGQQLSAPPRSSALQHTIQCQLVTLFLLELCQSPSATASGITPRLTATALDHYLRQHLANPPSNKALADHFHLSESHLQTLCQRQFGCTPQQYSMRLRLHIAEQRLRHPRLTLSNIAEELGFADASSFTRAFKHHSGQTPGHVRRLLKG